MDISTSHESRVWPISCPEACSSDGRKVVENPAKIPGQGKMKKPCNPCGYRTFSWSEWRDLNSRPLDPQSSALPAALHPDADVRFTQLDYITTRHQKKQVLFSKKHIFLFRHLPGKRGFPKRKDIPMDVFSFGGDTRI